MRFLLLQQSFWALRLEQGESYCTNTGAGEGAGKGSLKKPPNTVLPCLVGITCSAYFACQSTNIAVFQNEICRDTVFPATGPMHLMDACDLNFTHVFKILNKNICVKTDVNGVAEGKTEMEKEEKVVSTMQKTLKGV